MADYVEQWLVSIGLGAVIADVAATGIMVAAVAVVALLIGVIARLVIRRVLGKIIALRPVPWMEILYNRKVFHRMVPLATWVVLAAVLPVVLDLDSAFGQFVLRMVRSIFTALIITAAGVWLDGFNAIYETNPASRQRPMKGYLQLVRIFLYGVAAIIVVTALLNMSPIAILSGFGAASAVLLLVFRDTLLGLVSGVQLSSNDMVRIGDWIEMPKYGADGDVVDINLQTVKVRNWDMTITTIPIYALISDSFKNWRGMSESGGRRISRSINIDAETIRFLTAEELETFGRSELLGPYITQKLTDIAARPGAQDEKDPARRRLTNLGTFRAYVNRYIEVHPGINQEMIHMVRQLHPTPEGIPLQVYAFTRDKAWIAYETVQADIFDHLLAVIERFGLRVYQHPSGADLLHVAQELRGQLAGRGSS
ncbi:MAG: mechanosensitive ion channel family protein [Spirochaetaceae bacterium]|nr:MAG: mechanosensitive ion channel family protein [Spirochaetaceae bacterium]